MYLRVGRIVVSRMPGQVWVTWIHRKAIRLW